MVLSQYNRPLLDFEEVILKDVNCLRWCMFKARANGKSMTQTYYFMYHLELLSLLHYLIEKYTKEV